MAHLWSQVDMIAAEALRHLRDALVIAPLAARDKTAEFTQRPNGYRVGDTVRIKTRPEYVTKEFTAGGSVEKQSIRESHRTMSIEKHFDVSVEVGTREKTMDMESFSTQVIQPAAASLAESCDIYTGSKILQGRGLYRSNTLYETASDMALARKAATLQQLNPGNRYNLVNLDITRHPIC